MAMDVSALSPAIKQKWRFGAPQEGDLTNLRVVALARKLAALRAEGLALYQPLPAAEAFHASLKKFRTVTGSNRAGKTCCAAAESCRIWTGSDPYDKAPKRDGASWAIGLDGDHLALMWSICSKPGAFKVIRDEETRLWRAVRPDPNDPTRLDAYDEAYREKWKDAPPLLPPRIIKGNPAWEDKAKGIPRKVTLLNGWEILWRSSKGDSPQGDHLNWVWIDEQIENEDFYDEGKRGLVGLSEQAKHMPRFVWSATPQTFNTQLLDLKERADAGAKDVDSFQLLIAANPYIPKEEKESFYNGLDEEERDVRWHGIPAIIRQRVYQHYDPQGVHGFDPFPMDLSRYCRYVALDPGRQHCGTVFVAIDPEEKHRWLFHGFDLRNADAQAWAGEVARHEHGMKFEAFVIDQQMGKQTRPGLGSANTAQQYFEALLNAGITPRTMGPLNGFFPGTNDVSAREESLIRWLTIRGTGPWAGLPLLQVQRGCCPQLDKQFRNARYRNGKRDKTVTQDILESLEYISAFDPRYHPPVPSFTPGTQKKQTVQDQFQARKARIAARRRRR